jgi:pimeloyl-ACP methyl ester carboxylesterase
LLKKIIFRVLKLIAALYILVCIALYFFQEKILFLPEKLSADFNFSFPGKFDELNLKTKDETYLNCLHFKADSAKGVIIYLHGNAGSLQGWGKVAETYTNFNYDVFIFDYRGYGKSTGVINDEEILHSDAQLVYDYVKSIYDEDKITVLGYSLGTGPATKLASANNPKQLILQAPYYSIKDMMQHNYKFVPTFLLKYPLETNKYISQCKCAVFIFHGNKDEVIYYESSVMLRAIAPEKIKLITLKDAGHNGMTYRDDYILELQKIMP